MAQTDDPIADRGAQLDAAWALYTVGMDRVNADYNDRITEAADDRSGQERALFAAYQERVRQINGAGQEADGIEESGNDGPAD